MSVCKQAKKNNASNVYSSPPSPTPQPLFLLSTELVQQTSSKKSKGNNLLKST
eukprot:m.16964 g.16964  ORF g.16964 m.16964 type:complete len:53 (-) comp4698_c0_seq1:49-207(-)